MGQSQQLDLRQSEGGQNMHSMSWQKTSGGEIALNTTEGTSPYSVSQFCYLRGDLQAVTEMPKDVGSTGYVCATVLYMTTAFNLQAQVPGTAYAQEHKAAATEKICERT